MPGQSSPKAHILLVDDRVENLQTLEAVLSDLHENLVFASSGEEALKRVLETDFAAIVLDVRMPGMDGLETAAVIRQRDRSRRTPIIFVTAYGENDERVREGYSLGAVDFLFKPIVPEILRTKLAVFVDLHRMTEEVRRADEVLHQRQLAEERQRWEAEQLRNEVEREREIREELEASYHKLKELEKLRDDLTSMIVHDLRSPLASMITGLQLLETLGALNDEQKEMLGMTVHSGQGLLRLISDLLDIGKMEEGSLSLDCDDVNPAALVKASISQLEHTAREKQIVIHTDVPGPLPCVRADSEKLMRTVTNLLSNALKFTPPGGTVTVSIRPDESQETARFSVSDTGEGIPEEARERIFEKFGQVESRKAGRRMSTGLGLTFCKMVVEAHEGRIWVESAPGQGSTFSFELPISGPTAI